jgi:hypothetical protein
MSDAEKDQWVARVLGLKAPSAGAAEAAAVAPDTGFRRMMLTWREAQGRLAAALDALAGDLLGRQEVRDDPRFEDVKAAAAELPKLVPAFGGELEDALDAGINEGHGPRAAALAAEAIAAIDKYRQKLAGAAELAALEAFARDDLGSPVALGSDLDAELAAMRGQLAKTA